MDYVNLSCRVATTIQDGIDPDRIALDAIVDRQRGTVWSKADGIRK